MKKIPLSKPSTNQSDTAEIVQALKNSKYTEAESFESAVAKFCEVKFAISFNSYLAAIQATFQTLEITPFDRIITSPNNSPAIVSTTLQYGAKPSFVDVELSTGNISLKQLFEAINCQSSRGRNIIIPSHFSGITFDLQKLYSSIKSLDTIIVEDGFRAIGGCYCDGKKIGSSDFSSMTIFNFDEQSAVNSNSGMVTTNDKDLYDKLKSFRDLLELHPSSMQSALGHHQLKRISHTLKKRKKIVEWYRERLSRTRSINMVPQSFDSFSSYSAFAIQSDSKEEISRNLSKNGIETKSSFKPVYHLSFKDLNANLQNYFPNAEKYYRDALLLPFYTDLKEEDVGLICAEIKNTRQHHRGRARHSNKKR